MQNFNQFNLKDRPYVSFSSMSGPEGNPIEIAKLFHAGLSQAGFKEEGNYLGGNNLSHVISKLGNFDYEFIKSILFNMSETTYEITEKNKEDDDDVIVVIKKKKPSNDIEKENYLGRSSIYYANTSNMAERIMEDRDAFISKDKIGMSVLDHYLMAEKNEEYILALQFMYINYLPEEYEGLLNNKVFNKVNIVEEIKEPSFESRIYKNLLKYAISKNDIHVEDSMNFLLENIKKYKNKITQAQLGDIFLSISGVSEIAKHNPDASDYFNKLLNNFKVIQKADVMNDMIEKFKGSKEGLVQLEKGFISLSLAEMELTPQDTNKPKARRL